LFDSLDFEESNKSKDLDQQQFQREMDKYDEIMATAQNIAETGR